MRILRTIDVGSSYYKRIICVRDRIKNGEWTSGYGELFENDFQLPRGFL